MKSALFIQQRPIRKRNKNAEEKTSTILYHDATHYEEEKTSYKLELTSEGMVKIPLKQNGDFRSHECIEILKEADIVITNPPFSLFREYMAQLIEYDKKFIILGNVNSLTYKDVFPLIKDGKLWLGASIHSGDIEFKVSKDYSANSSGARVDENGNLFLRVSGGFPNCSPNPVITLAPTFSSVVLFLE